MVESVLGFSIFIHIYIIYIMINIYMFDLIVVICRFFTIYLFLFFVSNIIFIVVVLAAFLFHWNQYGMSISVFPIGIVEFVWFQVSSPYHDHCNYCCKVCCCCGPVVSSVAAVSKDYR